ncbi:hypothetical protein PITC_083460 [Penicillium italicum]|uniref:F-box domain-containing protein n=1 Tax=Penicillium italicum TaxID=40296 RepID=A0A0A2L3S9_PENIT|nr:hypothetical protein PITC_083460 [Penicillium italicum]
MFPYTSATILLFIVFPGTLHFLVRKKETQCGPTSNNKKERLNLRLQTLIDSLSIEILLTILECLSPLDLLSASTASPILYRTFATYKQHLLGHILRQAMPMPSVEERLGGLWVDTEALSKVKG